MAMGVAAEATQRLQTAVRSHSALSGTGMLEYLFASLFKGLVYPQIWEDPQVDLAALAITPDCRIVTIASGGCNVLSYLTADPAHITAVDLNPAHVALNRLKLAAAQRLPSWEAFYRFFGEADTRANLAAYRRFIAPYLDVETRAYWDTRSAGQFGRRRIGMFARGFHRHGLLGRFIGFGHALSRLYEVDLAKILRAGSLAEQRRIFETEIAPLFDKRLVRWVTARRASLFGLGIPPAQYHALAGSDDMADVLRERVRKLACDFPVSDNYFAWQAFGRAYRAGRCGPLPPYLQREAFATIRARAGRVNVLNRSLTEHLDGCPPQLQDRFVLLDAQDWMTDAQLNALWRAITRAARPGARVIFRTAAEPSLLPGRLDAGLLARWRYETEQSIALGARDRSAIYGGFHLYVLKD